MSKMADQAIDFDMNDEQEENTRILEDLKKKLQIRRKIEYIIDQSQLFLHKNRKFRISRRCKLKAEKQN